MGTHNMRKTTVWVKPNDNDPGYDLVVKTGFSTPEKSIYTNNVGVINGSRLLKSLKKIRKIKLLRLKQKLIVKPLKLGFLKLKSYPTQWIASLYTTDNTYYRYKAKTRQHVIIPQCDHINLNEIPKNSTVTYHCPICDKSITRHKRSGKINYPTHTHTVNGKTVKSLCYPVKVTYADITLYLRFKAPKPSTETYPISINDYTPKPSTLKHNYDLIPEYYNNHYEKCLTFNPNRINISTLGYVKPLAEINDYDRLTVITS